MRRMKMQILGAVIGMLSLNTVANTPSNHPEHVTTLPTMTILAEPELSQETGFVPYLEDESSRRALQHQVIRSTQEARNFEINPDVLKNINMQYQPPQDFSHIHPVLQQYAMGIAQGLQSSDPTQGLFTMLAPYGIDRGNALSGDRGGLQIQLDPGKLSFSLPAFNLNSQPVPPRMQ